MKHLFLFSAILASLFVASQNIVKINEEVYSTEGFLNHYANNIKYNGLDNALESFIKSEVLVLEAKKMGLDTTKFVRHQVAIRTQPLRNEFLGIQKIKDRLEKESLERTLNERKVQMLSVPFPNTFSPQDTLTKYNKAQRIYKQLIDRKTSFSKLKKKAEEEKILVNQNPVWIKAFELDYRLEDLIYNQPIGSISTPILVGNAYYIVHVLESRKASGTFYLNQIYVSGTQEGERKIKEVHKQLLDGKDFKKLVRQYSEDLKTNKNEGNLPPLKSSDLSDEFLKTIKELKQGEFTKPIKKENDWYIFRLRGQELPCNNEIKCKKEIGQKVLASSKIRILDSAVIAKAKTLIEVKTYPKNLEELLNEVSERFFQDKNEKITFKGDKIIVELASRRFHQKELVELLNEAQKKLPPNTDLKYFVEKQLEEIQNQILLDEFSSNLRTHNKAFDDFIESATKSILIEEFIQNTVYPEAAADEQGMRAYLSKNQDQYIWPKRIDANIFVCKNLSIAQKVKELIKDGTDPKLILEKLNETTPSNSEVNVFLKSGKIATNSPEIPKGAKIKKGTQILKDKKYKVLHINSLIRSQPMKYEEISESIFRKYKDVFLEEWTNKLLEKADIQINQEEVKKLRDTNNN